MSVPRSSASTRHRPSQRPFTIGVWLSGSNSTPVTSISWGWTRSTVEERRMHWELLLQHRSFELRRSGRFLVAALNEPHHVLSTSVRNGGQVDHVRYLLNHQS